MSDDLVPRIPLMSAAKARDIGRAYKAFAEMLHDAQLTTEAARAERNGRFWMAYSIALAQTAPEQEGT